MAFKELMARIAERRAQRGEGAEGEGAEKEPGKGQKIAAAVAGIAGGVKAPASAGKGGDLATRDLTYLASQNKWGNIKGLGAPESAESAEQEAKPKLPQEEEEEEEEEEKKEGEENVSEDVGEKLNSRISDLTESDMAGAQAAMDIFDIAGGAK